MLKGHGLIAFFTGFLYNFLCVFIDLFFFFFATLPSFLLPRNLCSLLEFNFYLKILSNHIEIYFDELIFLKF